MNLVKSFILAAGFLYALNGVTGAHASKIFHRAQVFTHNFEDGVSDANRLGMLSPAQQDQIIQQHLRNSDLQADVKR